MKNKTLHVTWIAHKHWQALRYLLDIYSFMQAWPTKRSCFRPQGFVCIEVWENKCNKCRETNSKTRRDLITSIENVPSSQRDGKFQWGDGHVNSTRSDRILNALVLIFLTNSDKYSRITSAKFPSFCMETFSVNGTKFIVPLHQSRVCSYYVGRRIVAPPPLWLQKHPDLFA